MDLDIEDLHIIESLVNYLLIPEIANIVIDHLGFRQRYNELIDQNINIIIISSHIIIKEIWLSDFIEEKHINCVNGYQL